MAKAKSENSSRPVMSPEQLLAWRKRQKMSQEELAEATWSTLGTVRNYEQGRREVPPIFQRTLQLIVQTNNLKAKLA